MRTVFLGTPEAAVPSLVELARVSQVMTVMTQPDRPRGRRGSPQPSPVKEAAGELGLPVIQPVRSAEIGPALAKLGPLDVAVIVAFGMLIRPDALAVPASGFLNVHFSLLPRWRGAAPVQRAMLAGDARTGITLMQLDHGLDTGPILVSRSTAIGPDETAGEITARLSAMGASLVGRHLEAIVAGSVTPVSQPTLESTHAPKLDRHDRQFVPDADAATVRRSIMALAPSPGVTATLPDSTLRLLRAGVIRHGVDAPPGTLALSDGRLWCAAQDGWVELVVVQPAGKRAMGGMEWARAGGRLPVRLT